MHVLVHVKAATLTYVTCGVGWLATNRVTEHLFLAQTSLPSKLLRKRTQHYLSVEACVTFLSEVVLSKVICHCCCCRDMHHVPELQK